MQSSATPSASENSVGDSSDNRVGVIPRPGRLPGRNLAINGERLGSAATGPRDRIGADGVTPVCGVPRVTEQLITKQSRGRTGHAAIGHGRAGREPGTETDIVGRTVGTGDREGGGGIRQNPRIGPKGQRSRRERAGGLNRSSDGESAGDGTAVGRRRGDGINIGTGSDKLPGRDQRIYGEGLTGARTRAGQDIRTSYVAKVKRPRRIPEQSVAQRGRSERHLPVSRGRTRPSPVIETDCECGTVGAGN